MPEQTGVVHMPGDQEGPWHLNAWISRTRAAQCPAGMLSLKGPAAETLQVSPARWSSGWGGGHGSGVTPGGGLISSIRFSQEAQQMRHRFQGLLWGAPDSALTGLPEPFVRLSGIL